MPCPSRWLQGGAPAHVCAIISHPDAGKTTSPRSSCSTRGAITSGGAVKAHGGRRRHVRLDGHGAEEGHLDHVDGAELPGTATTINLLDTPGHRTSPRTPTGCSSAVDAVVMVLDSAKGIEPQTLKLFEVCRPAHLPVITFLNKSTARA